MTVCIEPRSAQEKEIRSLLATQKFFKSAVNPESLEGSRVADALARYLCGQTKQDYIGSGSDFAKLGALLADQVQLVGLCQITVAGRTELYVACIDVLVKGPVYEGVPKYLKADKFLKLARQEGGKYRNVLDVFNELPRADVMAVGKLDAAKCLLN